MNTIPMLNRNILISIKPTYASKILHGEKTVELRRRFPVDSVVGSRMFIYSSSPVQAIVGYADILNVHRDSIVNLWNYYKNFSCIEKIDFDEYFSDLDHGYAISLGSVVKILEPIKVSCLRDDWGYLPPQSYRYIDNEFTSYVTNAKIQNTC